MRKIILFLLFVPLFASSQKLSTIEEKTKDLKKFEGFLISTGMKTQVKYGSK